MAATHLSRVTFNGVNTTSFSHSVDAGTADDRVLIVFVRHGSSAGGNTHSTPTYNGVSMTQVGNSIYDANPSNTNRRFSAWKMVDPPTGSNTLAGGFSAEIQQYSVTAVVAERAEDIDATTIASLETQSATTNHSLDITPDDANSLVYVMVMSQQNVADPYTPITDTTEIEDSDVDATTTNHNFATGTATVVTAGVAQTVGFTADSSDEWAGIALEVTEAAAGPTTIELAGTIAGSSQVGSGDTTEDGYITLVSADSEHISTADHTSFNFSGDFDIRVLIELSDYGADHSIINKWVTTGNQRAYIFLLNSGNLQFLSSPDGSTIDIANGGALSVSSKSWLRVTYTSSTGAVQFFSSSDGGNTWDIEGSDTATIGGVFNSTADMVIGDTDTDTLDGDVFAAEFYDGIDGTLISDPDFRTDDQKTSSTTFEDTGSHTWTLQNGATRVDPVVAGTDLDVLALNELAGESPGDATVTGVLHGFSSAGGSSVTAALTVEAVTIEELEGSSDGTGSVAGSLDVVTVLAAESDGTATVTGEAELVYQLLGTTSGVATSTGDLDVVIQLASTVLGQADVAGDLELVRQLQGVASGTSTTTAALSNVVPETFRGLIIGSPAPVLV